MQVNLPIIKLRIEYKALADINFQLYSGSVFRGAFGNQLRQVACSCNHEDCDDCHDYNTCPYANILKVRFIKILKMVHNLWLLLILYVFEPLPVGKRFINKNENFSINIILFGKAIEQLPVVILALIQAGAHGFTDELVPAKLVSITQLLPGTQKNIYNCEVSHDFLNEVTPFYKLNILEVFNEARIQLLTPTRLVIKGRNVSQDELTSEIFLQSAIRRINSLYECHTTEGIDRNIFIPENDANELIKEIQMTDIKLNWLDWSRYSSRQNKKVPLGGLVGEFKLNGPLTKLLPYLQACHILHLGKASVMGMGRYNIV